MQQFKIGVFGCDVNGKSFAKNFMRQNCDIVAACDPLADKKDSFLKSVDRGCVWYDTFEAFINHPMDAVVLTNLFPKHIHYAIRCLEKGIHVFSECSLGSTMAEGVKLIRAAEKSNAIYMLAENYPQMLINIEMQRVCKGGSLGKILYAEGEYNYPHHYNNKEVQGRLAKSHRHWHHFLPTSYNITHSLAPIMKATGATPKKVNAFWVSSSLPCDTSSSSFTGDEVTIISTLNDDGSIFKVTGCTRYGGQHNSYRICGTEGQIENLRGMGNKIMLRYNEWSKPQDNEVVTLYSPSWDDKDKALLRACGQDGSVFLTVRLFLDCLRENRLPEPPFDVHSAVTMSSVALLSYRSALEGGKTYDIPDFHLEEYRNQYEKDTVSPFYGADQSVPTLPCFSKNPESNPTRKQI